MTSSAPAHRLIMPLEHPIYAWYNLERSGRATWILLALFVLAWTTFQVLAFASIDLHPDLTEIYAWSRHPSAGYYKHPPLPALVAAGWFAVFPVADWSIHLLAIVTSALALFVVDLIARRYLSGDKRLLALLLLLLTPFMVSDLTTIRYCSGPGRLRPIVSCAPSRRARSCGRRPPELRLRWLCWASTTRSISSPPWSLPR